MTDPNGKRICFECEGGLDVCNFGSRYCDRYTGILKDRLVNKLVDAIDRLVVPLGGDNVQT